MLNKFHAMQTQKRIKNRRAELAKLGMLVRMSASSHAHKKQIEQIGIRFSSGFTLIELIVVIVILGILAATAMPKFIDMRREARIATLNGLVGAMRSSMVLVEGACRLQGLSPSATAPDGQDYDQHIVTADGAWVETFCNGSNGVPQMPSVPYISGMVTMMGCPVTEGQLFALGLTVAPTRPENGFSCNGMTIYSMWMTVDQLTNGEISGNGSMSAMAEWQIGRGGQPGCAVRYLPFYVSPNASYVPIIYMDTTDC